MKKVHEDDLCNRVEQIIEECDTTEDAAWHVVAVLKDIQDASGVKVCTNTNEGDIAVKEA